MFEEQNHSLSEKEKHILPSIALSLLDERVEEDIIEDMKVEQLVFIQESIEAMDKKHQIQVLHLLSQAIKEKKDIHESFTLNENKYGVHINLSVLPQCILKKLLVFIENVHHERVSSTTITTLNELQTDLNSFPQNN